MVVNLARGATVVVPVSEDTTIFELGPTSNLGAAILGAGAINQIDPNTGAPGRMRALLRFDLSVIPSAATVTSAEMNVTLVRSPQVGEPVGSQFELRRVLKPWGEGNKGGNTGFPASDGEATWLAPRHPEPAWSGAGASGAGDAVSAISSSVAMDREGSYKFPSTTELVADVQGWLGEPASNFGWIMRSAAEDAKQSARRFASKESATGKPTLTVTYEIAAAELRIVQFALAPEGMFLSWTGGTPPFRVERAESVSGAWTPVTAPANETQAIAPAGPAAAFYRVVSIAP